MGSIQRRVFPSYKSWKILRRVASRNSFVVIGVFVFFFLLLHFVLALSNGSYCSERESFYNICTEKIVHRKHERRQIKNSPFTSSNVVVAVFWFMHRYVATMPPFSTFFFFVFLPCPRDVQVHQNKTIRLSMNKSTPWCCSKNLSNRKSPLYVYQLECKWKWPYRTHYPLKSKSVLVFVNFQPLRSGWGAFETRFVLSTFDAT